MLTIESIQASSVIPALGAGLSVSVHQIPKQCEDSFASERTLRCLQEEIGVQSFDSSGPESNPKPWPVDDPQYLNIQVDFRLRDPVVWARCPYHRCMLICHTTKPMTSQQQTAFALSVLPDGLIFGFPQFMSRHSSIPGTITHSSQCQRASMIGQGIPRIMLPHRPPKKLNIIVLTTKTVDRWRIRFRRHRARTCGEA